MSKKMESQFKIDKEGVLSRAEHFVQQNKKSLTIIVIAIFGIIGGYFGYKYMVVAPKEKEANDYIYKAQDYFEKDNFKFALNGDGNNPGFLTIIDDYSGTKAADLAYFYSGICYLRLGKFQEAIDNLEQFEGEDQILTPLCKGAIGDAYIELNKLDDAIKYYTEAVDEDENDFTTPMFLMKLGFANELKNDYKSAIVCYERIEKEFKNTEQGRMIEKYIVRAKMKK